ncbi:MAG: AMP-dependent synthetase [Rhodospirillales bacterium]|nr:MAG: AMP-dependent synthetase [Rhodospirillales bacterium]
MTATVWTPARLLDRIAARGDKPALIMVSGDETKSVSGAALAEQVSRLARALAADGVAPGEPVCLFAPNGPEWVAARLGIALAGAVGTAIDHLADADEAAMILKDSGCRRVLTSREHLDLILELGEERDLSVITIDGSGRDAGAARDWADLPTEGRADLPEIAPDADAALVYTSGTTGAPKSFFLTWANISVNVEAIAGLGVVNAEDRLLLPLPLHHVYPFVVGLLTPMVIGASVVFPEAPAGPQIIRALKASRASVIIGVPRLYEAMLTAIRQRVAGRGRVAETLFRLMLNLSIWSARRLERRIGRRLFASLHRQFGPDLRLMVSAGAKLAPESIWPLIGLGWQVLTGYGLAETSSAFTGNVPGRLRIGSEGRPLNDGEVRIGDPDENGVGEIQLRGPNVFRGYRNNEEANRTAFSGDGWFRSGDLGCVDPDGFVFVTGRIKELIVLGGGKNVFPEELEAVYGQSPAIREIAVLERSGALVALVVPEVEAAKDAPSGLIEDVIRVHLTSTGRNLPSHQRLSGFALTRQPLPRTRLGKYQRFQLPALYEAAKRGETGQVAEEPSGDDRALIEASPGRDIWAMLKRRYPDKPLRLDAHPQLDLGIDSLEWLNIGMELEETLGLRLAEQDIAEAETVRELIRLAERGAQRRSEAGERPGAGIDAPLSEADRRWLAPPGPALKVLQLVLYGLNVGLMWALFRVRTEGKEHLPASDPYVIIANHASDVDPPVMAGALSFSRLRRLRWAGDNRRLFRGPIRRAFSRAAGIFPVDARAPSQSLAMAAAVLAEGQSLVWFPEMWRSPTGELQRFLPGIGVLLQHHPVPVVPAFIDGTFEAMPRDRRLPRPHPVRVIFGEPVDTEALLRALDVGDDDRAAERIADALRDRVAALQPAPAGGTDS